MATVAIDRMETENMHMPRFWCHECREGVSTDYNQQSSEMECSSCGGCFVEEMDSETSSDPPQEFITHTLPQGTRASGTNADTQTPDGSANSASNSSNQALDPGNRQEINSSRQPLLSAVPPSMGSLPHIVQQLPGDSSLEPPSIEVHFGSSPMDYTLWNMLGGGAIRNILQIPVSAGASVVAGNLGDYAFGNLSSIINQLMQSDPNQHGAPPASQSAVRNLPDVYISQDAVRRREECAVCKDVFGLNEHTKELPCQHLFHPGCILPWLERHNSCPLCRHEMPTDDPDYERRRQETSVRDQSTEH